MIPLTISKIVPATTRTETALWCKRDFLPMSQEFRQARERVGKPINECYWCGHSFEDGEMLALAAFVESGNKVLCQPCADELLSSRKDGE